MLIITASVSFFVTDVIAGGCTTFPNGTTSGCEGLSGGAKSTLPNDPTTGGNGTSSSVQSEIRTSGQSVSPAETAALLAQHNVNAKANANRWEDLVCSLRPVKGKTIEGILFRNEIPFWYNCND